MDWIQNLNFIGTQIIQQLANRNKPLSWDLIKEATPKK